MISFSDQCNSIEGFSLTGYHLLCTNISLSTILLMVSLITKSIACTCVCIFICFLYMRCLLRGYLVTCADLCEKFDGIITKPNIPTNVIGKIMMHIEFAYGAHSSTLPALLSLTCYSLSKAFFIAEYKNLPSCFFLETFHAL